MISEIKKMYDELKDSRKNSAIVNAIFTYAEHWQLTELETMIFLAKNLKSDLDALQKNFEDYVKHDIRPLGISISKEQWDYLKIKDKE